MMNQRIVIYIILSAVLLYLYYRRRDLAIFAVFVVVVGTTLIFRNGGASASEGFSVGGIGGGGGSSGSGGCAKLGFTTPKIDKDDVKGSLEKVMKNVKTVAEKYVDFDENQPAPKKEYEEAIKFIASSEIAKTEIEKMNNNKETREYLQHFGFLTIELIQPYILKPSVEKQDKFIKGIDKYNTKNETGVSPLTMILKGGPIALDILNKIKKSDEMKEATKEAKTLLEALICSVKQLNSIWKNIQKATADGSSGDAGGAGGGGDDDEEEKPKKKKKKAKKEEDAEDDE